LEGWLKQYKKIGQAEGYTPESIAEYGLYISVAVEWQKIHGNRIKENSEE
jgi:hypothetical protein